MNDVDRGRCEHFSRVLFGSSPKSKEVGELIGMCSSYEEFRIRAVLDFASRNELAKNVAAYWQQQVDHADEGVDGNALLHMLESLAEKQAELERKMRHSSVELLDKLKAIDAAATAHVAWRESLEEIRFQMSELRKRLDQMDRSGPGRQESSK